MLENPASVKASNDDLLWRLGKILELAIEFLVKEGGVMSLDERYLVIRVFFSAECHFALHLLGLEETQSQVLFESAVV